MRSNWTRIFWTTSPSSRRAWIEIIWSSTATPKGSIALLAEGADIRKLRVKLEDDPQNPKLIQTVWGKGYRFG